MALNPALYRVLVKHFGEVKVYNEGIRRREERIPGKREYQIVERGESYNVDCPLCGDEKQRLSIGYQWLCKRPLTNRRITHLAHCYNEDCPVTNERFWALFLDDLRAAEMGLLDDIQVSERTVSARVQKGRIEMPCGCQPIGELGESHPAIQFMFDRYPGLRRSYKAIRYLSDMYGVCYTDAYDPAFHPSQDRLIFPIYDGGQRVAWQGRTIHQDVRPRWYCPPGFVKCFYNAGRLSPYEIPVLNEGVLNAIFCGPTGIAMFGKALNSMRAEQLSQSFQAVIIATDPDTFVPDNRPGGHGRIFARELQELVSRFIPDTRMLVWPPEVLEIARRHNDGEDLAVPDAAVLGFRTMRKLIERVACA